MAYVFIDRDGADIVVRVARLAATKEWRFVDRAKAERFAASKLGKRSGMLVSTLDMTAEQLAAHREREARARKLLEEVRP